MRKVCIRYKQDNHEARQAFDVLKLYFSKKSIEIVEEADAHTELCICISGDGNLLSFVRSLKDLRHSIPVLGIHGSKGVGFLHSLRLPLEGQDYGVWASEIVELCTNKKYTIQDRFGLLGRVGTRLENIWALNDLVVSRGELSRLISLRVKVEGETLFARMRGDGIVVASATGSTGYNLAAGGPVIAPTLQVNVITPLAPHDAGQRPFVLDAKEKIAIEILDNQSSVFLTSDGQAGFELKAGETVEIEYCPRPVKWAIMKCSQDGSRSYFETLRKKRGFEGDN